MIYKRKKEKEWQMDVKWEYCFMKKVNEKCHVFIVLVNRDDKPKKNNATDM